MRGVFAVLDFVPGIDFFKVWKSGGAKAVGIQYMQGLLGINAVDDFATMFRRLNDMTGHISKQLDELGGNTVTSGGKQLDEVTSPGGKKFSLNEPPEKIDALSQSIPILKDFEAGRLLFEDVLEDYAAQYASVVNSNKVWPWDDRITGGDLLTATQKSKIKATAIKQGLLPRIAVIPSPGMRYGFTDFRGAGVVDKTVQLPQELWLKSDKEQFDYLIKRIGGPKPGMTWHHSEIPGQMELIPFGIHNIVPHNGGRAPGMWAYAPR